MNKKIIVPLLFLLPGLSGFIVFYIAPFLLSVYYSLLDQPSSGNFVGLDNYIGLFSNQSYLIGLENTLKMVLIGVPLCTILSLAFSMMVDKLPKKKKLLILIFLIPMVVPTGSTAFFWKSFFEKDGFFNRILFEFGFDTVLWLESEVARYVMIGIFIWKNVGYNMVLFVSGLSNIPKDYYEYAYTCGAGKWKAFTNITLIYLTPTFFLVIVMSIINTFKIFKEVFFMTGTYPHTSVYTLQHFMNNMFSSLNYPKLTAATSLLVLIIIIVTQGLFAAERRLSP